MKTLIPVLACVLASLTSGCATTAKFDEHCKSWVGKDESSLVSGWGVPTKTYDVDSSTKLIEYFLDNGTTIGNTSFYGADPNYVVIQHSCKVTFTLTGRVVSSYRWEGNSCKSK